MICRADAAKIPLRAGSVHMVVTSPPYWGLRKYGGWGMQLCWGSREHFPGPRRHPDQHWSRLRVRAHLRNGIFCPKGCCWIGALGLEPTPELYVAHLVEVFREVWRVLRDDGTLWLNLGDSYITATHGTSATADPKWPGVRDRASDGVNRPRSSFRRDRLGMEGTEAHRPAPGLKAKDMVGIPWRVAFALQADGWTLRSDIIWAKPNPMPESVTDRPTKAHEYLFLLAKRERYYYNAEAIAESRASANGRGVAGWTSGPGSHSTIGHNRDKGDARTFRGGQYVKGNKFLNSHATERNSHGNGPALNPSRNRRTVWEIPTQPYPEAHFATFPEDLVTPCVLAGTSERGCCAACGAPQERITATVSVDRDGPEYTGKHAASAEHAGGRRILGAVAAGRAAGLPHDNPVPPRLTVGWEPTCACPAAELTKPVVLDPFAGSGTVGEVCHRLGRRFVGLELAEAYVALAKRRTAQLGLL